MVRILAFDASQEPASVALLADELVAEERLPEGAGATEHLVSLILQLAARAKWSLNAVDLVAVGVGPGGFTGVRVGVAAARALGVVNGVALVPVTYFETGLVAARRAGVTGAVQVLKSIGRGQLIRQRFLPNGDRDPRGALIERMADLRLSGTDVFLGDAVPAESPEARWSDAALSRHTPAAFAAFASEGGLARPVEPSSLKPFYPRLPDAQPFKAAGLGGSARS